MALFQQKRDGTGYNPDFGQRITIDLTDDDNFYYVYAEFPGREKKDIKIKFKGDCLSLRISEDEDYANQDYIISERNHEERERIIKFDCAINKKDVKAAFLNGLLIITIKKIDPFEDDEQGLIQIF